MKYIFVTSYIHDDGSTLSNFGIHDGNIMALKHRYPNAVISLNHLCDNATEIIERIQSKYQDLIWNRCHPYILVSLILNEGEVLADKNVELELTRYKRERESIKAILQG